MAALKHPCVGDLTYGADPTLAKRFGLERQWLHAVRLGFEHPDSGGVRRVRRRSTPTTWPGPWRRSAVPTDDLVLRPVTPDDLPGDRRAAHPGPRGGVPRDAARPPPRPRGQAWVGGLGPVEVRRLGGRAAGASWPATPARTASGSTTSTSSPASRAPASAPPCSTWSRPSGRPGSACGSSRPTSRPAASTAPAAWSTSSAPTAPATRRRPPTSGWPGPAATRSRSTARLIDDGRRTSSATSSTGAPPSPARPAAQGHHRARPGPRARDRPRPGRARPRPGRGAAVPDRARDHQREPRRRGHLGGVGPEPRTVGGACHHRDSCRRRLRPFPQDPRRSASNP